MVKHWLITGGLGFIGRNLVSNLVSEGGHFIRIIDNLKVGSREDLIGICNFQEVDFTKIKNPNKHIQSVELVVGDITDAHLAYNVCKGFDVIVHLAANTGVAPSIENPRMDCATNVMGTLNYLEAARQCNVKRFVFASSGASLGEMKPPLHEELAPHPVSPYGASKLAGEGYCSSYNRTFGVETVCLRFGNVYGPLSEKKDSVVAKFIKRAMNGNELEIYGDGTQTRDFIYVADLVKAIRLAAARPSVGGEIFQIASNHETTISEMVAKLLRVLSKYGVTGVRSIHGEKRKGDVMRNFSDTRKARRVLGWTCKYELEFGLEKTVEWFFANMQTNNHNKILKNINR